MRETSKPHGGKVIASNLSNMKSESVSRSVVSDSSRRLSASSVHGILQAIILEWVATSFSSNYKDKGTNQYLYLGDLSPNTSEYKDT